MLLLALCIAELDFVRAAGRRAFHHLGNGRRAVFSQTVDAAAHEEFGTEIFSKAIELVNVALNRTEIAGGPNS
ncbi:hypothetical protein [Novosphingobium lindaniclasticum]